MVANSKGPAYPRDLAGYAGQPPAVRWPGAARVALQFVLNVEEGGESCVLHGDAASEILLSEIVCNLPSRTTICPSIMTWRTSSFATP